MQRLIQFWKSGTVGKLTLGCGGLIALLFVCGTCGVLFGQGPSREKPTEEPTATSTLVPTSTLSPTKVVTTPIGTTVPVPTYDVVEVDDISLAHSVRLRVVVTTEFPIVTEQIGALCEEVVQDLKSQGPLNAVVVFLYDTRSVVSGAYSIARCEYAPNGVWEDAGKVQAGDYSTHIFAYEYQPKVGDPDAALPERPTEQEYNLCQQWDRLAFELLSESDDVAASEALAYEQIAEENGVSIQTVEDAVFKCIFWTWR